MKTKKFEYLIILEKLSDMNFLFPTERMNDLGKQGWELISVIHDKGNYNMFFKRECDKEVIDEDKSKNDKFEGNWKRETLDDLIMYYEKAINTIT